MTADLDALIARNRQLQLQLFALYAEVERAACEGDEIDQGVIDDSKMLADEIAKSREAIAKHAVREKP